MEKDEILNKIKDLASLGLLTEEEVVEAIHHGKGSVYHKEEKHSLLSNILYYIGGAVVIIGIVILISQNWQLLSNATKILSSFGAGVVAYFVGVLLAKDDRFKAIGNAFHLVAGMVLPVGLFVIFDLSGFDIGNVTVAAEVSLMLLVLYAISFYLSRTILFNIFNIIFGTAFFFSITGLITQNSPQVFDYDFSEYRNLLLATSYVLLGHAFSKGKFKILTEYLYGLGSFVFFVTALILGGYRPEQNLFWEMIFPVTVFGTLWLSVQLRSKTLLTSASLFLMIYIIKITSEYFANDIGWPFALVLAGLLLIGVGFFSLRLNKKYITSR